MKTRTPIRPMHVREKSYLPHLLAIGCLWGLAMSMDYADKAAAAEENAAQAMQEADSLQKQMIDCMNGTWRGSTASGAQIACYKAEVLEAKERSKP